MSSVYNDAASSSSLPPEMLNALIITLPKPGKEPTYAQNFRPISLLNLDTKIYTKLIVKKLLNLMPILIYKDQSGFTKGRETSDATRRIINIIHRAESTQTPSLLLSLDPYYLP